MGTKNPDVVHTVLVNIHGFYSYISAGQYFHFRLLEGVSAILFLSTYFIDVLQKKYIDR
ncbi:MAG: hypothetical protein NVS3B3_11620 [Aquirhabdus sp.]